ncbi:MAG: lamin tail domain-containing protein [Myxococcota bacterium]|nr:lamin tail domain-containing protein [Myxococcota bacterium]
MSWILLASLGHAEVLINEVLYDPSGSDGPLEWVEICNNSQDDVNISGWMIEVTSSNWSEAWTFPPGTVIGGLDHYVFGPGVGDSSSFSPNIPNASSKTSGLRLVDETGLTVLDTLLYGDPNTDFWLDDLGSSAGPFAPDVSGSPLARSVDCYDTNAMLDFVESTNPTPGAPNIGGGEDCELTGEYGIVINEFVANPAGSDSDPAGREWIELRNNTSSTADLSSWSLMGGTQGPSELGVFESGTIIPAGGYLVIGGENAYMELGSAPDVVFDFSLGNATSNADGLQLVDCAGTVIDVAIYGESNEDGWTDEQGNVVVSFAPKPGDGASIGRLPDGVDSNDNGADFSELSFGTPWVQNDFVQDCPGSTDIKINEFLANPDSEESSEDATNEWVELYNSGSSDINLLGWALQWGTSSYSNQFTIEEEYWIPAGGHIVIGGESVAEADIVVSAENDLSLGAASSNADSLRLLHCGPGVSDTVIYGPSNEDGTADNTDEWIDDDGMIAESIAPKAVAGSSHARREDGLDSDDSGADFVIAQQSTPGSANPEIRCETGQFTIKINEIYPNPDGSDSGYEWVEIINVGSESVRLDDWELQTGESSWNSKLFFPPESEIGPGEIWLIGEDEVPAEFRDVTVEGTLSLGNASSGFDGVRLIDCPGQIQDSLLYAKDGAGVASDEEITEGDNGDTSAASLPESGLSLGRLPDGSDSDVNSVDFATNLEPTPGERNGGDSSGEQGSDPEPPSKGCGGDDEGGKCSAISAKTQFWIFGFAGLVGLMRRRVPPSSDPSA